MLKSIYRKLVIAFLALSLSGCSGVPQYEKLAELKLSERYDIQFKVDKVLEVNKYDGYFSVIAHPINDSDIVFKATINNDGSGESDNYVCKLVCRQISEQILRKLSSLNGFTYVYTTPLIDSVGLSDTNMTIEQYVNRYPDEVFHVYLNYSPSELDVDTLYSSILNMFEGVEAVNGEIYLYLVKDNTIRDIRSYFKTNDRLYDDYKSMVEPYYVMTIPFENGNISMTGSEFKSMLGGE